MCCPEGEGGGFRRGRVRWVEVGEAGDVVYHRGERGCDCSRQSNYCHALSMRNIKRESESESKRLWGTPPPYPTLHAVPPSLSNQIHLPSGAGWRTGIWLDGGGLSLAARCWREAGRREVRRRWLTLSLEEDTIHEPEYSHCSCLGPNIWIFLSYVTQIWYFLTKRKLRGTTIYPHCSGH